MSACYLPRQVKSVVRREQTTAGSESEVSTAMALANSYFLSRDDRIDEISHMSIMSSKGPRTLPWGTPLEHGVEDERFSPILICWRCLDRQLQNNRLPTDTKAE